MLKAIGVFEYQNHRAKPFCINLKNLKLRLVLMGICRPANRVRPFRLFVKKRQTLNKILLERLVYNL